MADRLRVFITGASSGLGEALARAWGARGAMLGLTARRRDLLVALNATLGGGHAVYPLDVRDSSALQAAAKDFIARCGAPDVVIANAGISVGVDTEDPRDLDVFQEIFDINVVGVARTFQPFIPAMKARGSGRLVGIASVAAVRGLPGGGAYSGAKAAVVRYLEALRIELRGTGVQVTTIAPGFMRTPMTTRNPYPMPFIIDVDDAARRILRAIDAGRTQATIPWPMALVTLLLAHLPNRLFDRVFAGRRRKPRRA